MEPAADENFDLGDRDGLNGWGGQTAGDYGGYTAERI
jgi:hypothetical protein